MEKPAPHSLEMTIRPKRLECFECSSGSLIEIRYYLAWLYLHKFHFMCGCGLFFLFFVENIR